MWKIFSFTWEIYLFTGQSVFIYKKSCGGSDIYRDMSNFLVFSATAVCNGISETPCMFPTVSSVFICEKNHIFTRTSWYDFFHTSLSTTTAVCNEIFETPCTFFTLGSGFIYEKSMGYFDKDTFIRIFSKYYLIQQYVTVFPKHPVH